MYIIHIELYSIAKTKIFEGKQKENSIIFTSEKILYWIFFG